VLINGILKKSLEKSKSDSSTLERWIVLVKKMMPKIRSDGWENVVNKAVRKKDDQGLEKNPSIAWARFTRKLL
jgi:hypothetical protein